MYRTTAYLVATWLLNRESNPDLQGMNLVCYLCTIQLYYKAQIIPTIQKQAVMLDCS